MTDLGFSLVVSHHFLYIKTAHIFIWQKKIIIALFQLTSSKQFVKDEYNLDDSKMTMSGLKYNWLGKYMPYQNSKQKAADNSEYFTEFKGIFSQILLLFYQDKVCCIQLLCGGIWAGEDERINRKTRSHISRTELCVAHVINMLPLTIYTALHIC